MENKVKAIVIDPIAKTVTEQEVLTGWQNISKLIGCQYIDGMYPLRNKKGKDVIYFDESGSYVKDLYAVSFNGMIPLFGKLIVMGQDKDGNSVNVNSTLQFVQSQIIFHGKVN